jgi:hypothetical protein
MELKHFNDLFSLDVNDKVEKKNKLSYLSWSFAWAETKKRYPDASYRIQKFDNGLPYVFDPRTGYMVFTEVTIEGITHEMWLLVMDGANKAMKDLPYEYSTKYGDKTVEAATMFDVNKTIMRCLVKNLAMFGLGLYIYAGEDLPEESEGDKVKRLEEEAKAKTLKEKAAKDLETKNIKLVQSSKTINELKINFGLAKPQTKAVVDAKDAMKIKLDKK